MAVKKKMCVLAIALVSVLAASCAHTAQEPLTYDSLFSETIQTAGFKKPELVYSGQQKLIALSLADESGFSNRFVPSAYISTSPEDVGAVILYDVVEWNSDQYGAPGALVGHITGYSMCYLLRMLDPYTGEFIGATYIYMGLPRIAPSNISNNKFYAYPDDEEVLAWVGATWSEYLSEDETNETPNNASDFSYVSNGDGITVTEYSGIGKRVVIPDAIENNPVTAIGYNAFRWSKVTSISIPESINHFENSAFGFASFLVDIIIPGNVGEISNTTFDSCRSLSSVTVQNGVTSISNDAFVRCSNLTRVTIPESVAFIEKDVFSDSPYVTVWCVEGSYAHAYCEESDINYVLTTK